MFLLKAGFVGFGEVNSPRELILNKCIKAKERLINKGFILVDTPPVTDDPDGKDVTRAVKDLKREQFDVLIICIAGWIPSHAVISVVREFKNKPMILWGLCGHIKEGRLITTADQAGTTAIRKVMQDMEYTFKFIYDCVDVPPKTDKIEDYAKAAQAFCKLKKSKIGMMGFRDMNLYDTLYDGVSLMNKIGPDVEVFEMLEITRKTKEISIDDIEKTVDSIKEKWVFENKYDDDILKKGASYYLAIKDKVLKRGYQAVSLIDVNGMKKIAGFPPAMIFMLLTDEMNLCTIPENDTLGCVTQLMVKYLTGQAAAYLEFYEFMSDGVLMGVPDYVPAEIVKGPVRVTTKGFGDFSKGILNVSEIKTGRVTLFRLSSSGDRYTMHMVTGRAVKPGKWEEAGWDPPAPQLPGLKIIPDCSVSKLAQNVMSQHYILAYGDHTKKMIDLCNMLQISLIYLKEGEVKATIPYTLPWDDMPIDLSFVYKDEKPAGKHGFLTVEGEKFVFEDGTDARFWGTNFNSGANFPSHTHSEKVACRLAKTGVNLVRFHQLDAEWSTPNIFQFTKGENKDNTKSLDPKSMDRLDYLIYRLKKEGIYVYLDLLTYRKFKTGDGVEKADLLPDAAKPYTIYNRRLIELQKKFNKDIWNHTNPYTGLAYKDEPAIVLTEICNENDLFSQKPKVEPYRTELEELYRTWAAENNVKLKQSKIDFSNIDDTMVMFFRKAHKEYYSELISHMRNIGVKIPITGTNWSRNAALLSCQAETDFTDSHSYWYTFGIWEAGNKRLMNNSMTASKENMLSGLAFNRLPGKPFFVSEWDDPWPNEWRAESPLLLAAAGSLQGWSGFAVHTYRYGTDEQTKMIGKTITSDAIGGVYYRGGVFDTFNDPAKFGLFYHAALITRRGDVKKAKESVGIKIKDYKTGAGIKALRITPEKNRVYTLLPGNSKKTDKVVLPNETILEENCKEVLSDTNELYRSFKKKIGWIDTPMTKAVYGFLGKEGDIRLNDFIINAETDFATVAVSSLTEEPIKCSKNMLLTAVGRAANTNSKYNEDHTKQLKPGHGPVRVEIIKAKIMIKTDSLRVLAVNPKGFIIGEVPSKYKDGEISFQLGFSYPSMYYLLQKH